MKSTAADVQPSDVLVFDVLRIAAAMCFIGHGAFGIITKASWLPYLAVAGIGPELGYRLMPVIGVIDILLGISMLRPTKAALAYMTVWATWTALLRPFAGQGVAEFLERAGNYGVPLALLLIGLVAYPSGRWLAPLTPRAIDAATARRLFRVLRLSTASLLLGHGLLAVSGKPLLAKHLGAIGIGDGGVASLHAVAAQGGFEIALAVMVLVYPPWPLVLVALSWKVAVELLFPLTGDSVWEFVERGGSFGAPLALILMDRAWSLARGILSPDRSLRIARDTPGL